MKTCPNCFYPNNPKAQFCAECGQRFRSSRLTVWELFREAFQDLFNLDNRLFRTIGALQAPGRLTNYYLMGHRKNYFPPFRVFLLSGLACLTAFSFLFQDELETNLREVSLNYQERGFQQVYLQKLQETHDTLADQQNLSEAGRAYVDTLITHTGGNVRDSIDFELMNLSLDSDIENPDLRIAYTDLVNMPIGDILDKYEVEGFWKRLVFYQTLKVNLETSGLVGYVFSILIWVLGVTAILTAAILKLLYIRRRRYFVEHLVFSLHLHAFYFFWGTIIVLYIQLAGSIPEPIIVLLSVLATLFLYVALRNVYRQKVLKTSIKMFLLLTFYMMSSTIAIVFVLLISMAFY